MNAVPAVRFGAWVLNRFDVKQNPGQAEKPSSTITLDLTPQDNSDFQFQHLPGLATGTNLAYHKPGVKLQLSTNDQGDLLLKSNYTSQEDYTYQQDVYEDYEVPAGRGMTDSWEEAHTESRYAGSETRHATRDKANEASVKVDNLGVFRNLLSLLDSVIVDTPLLLDAAKGEHPVTPNLAEAYKTLKAETKPLQNLLLDHKRLEQPIRNAFAADTPLLRDIVLHPAKALLAEHGKNASESLRAQAKDELIALRDKRRAEREAHRQSVAQLDALTRRITGSP